MGILKGRIISVISAKGGCGSTFISLNLSVCLASAGKTVLLDIEENSTSLMLNLKFDKAAEKLLAAKLNPEAFSSLLPVHSSGLYCSVLDSKDKECLKNITDILVCGFQTIIFDAGILFEDAGYLLEGSALILLVVNPDIVSLKAAENTLLKLASLYIEPEKIVIVLNKNNAAAGINEATVEKMLGKKVICSVPFDLSSMSCINRGQPLVISEPGSLAAGSIKALSEFVLNLKPFNKETVLLADKKTDEKIKEKVYASLLKAMEKMNIEIDSFIDPGKKEKLKIKVLEMLQTIIAAEFMEIKSKEKREYLIKLIIQEALGLGPLEDLLSDPRVTEIMVNGKDHVYVEREGKIILTDKKFLSNKQLAACIDRIVAPVGRRIDESVPLVDARLPDGSRINAIIPPLSLKGPSLTIRKFSRERLTVEDLIRYGSITEKAAEFLRLCVRSRKNIVISGGTGSGKTTLLNVIASFISGEDRIITIEDSAELNLPQEHVVTLETRPPNTEGKGAITIRDLVRNTLRMRPDRIVIGECRGGEALDMLQAMNTGHDGSLTTLHSNSPRDTLSRLETMVLMSGMNLPLRAVREQIASAVDVIIHQERFKDGTRKITHITEVAGMEGEIIAVQDLFIFRRSPDLKDGSIGGSLVPKGIMPGFINEILLIEKAFDRTIFRE